MQIFPFASRLGKQDLNTASLTKFWTLDQYRA